VLVQAGQALKLGRPLIYQEIGERRHVIAGGYDLRSDGSVGFEIGHYDKGKPLVIDPILELSSYIGGTGDDTPTGIARDSAGNLYLVGATASSDFPTESPLQPEHAGGGFLVTDVFVTKLDPTATTLLYSTYLGGTGDDSGHSIAVDTSGNVLITGTTSSTDFPTVQALQEDYRNAADVFGSDAFVAKLNATGSALIYSTYMGGSGLDSGSSIAVDADGNAVIAGATSSLDLPVVNAIQPAHGGGPQVSFDALFAKLNPQGAALFITYFGGSQDDIATGVKVHSTGAIYIAGQTSSQDFPTVEALQPTYGGSQDCFVAKLNDSGQVVHYSTFLGGTSADMALALALDEDGHVVVTGTTGSQNFTLINALQDEPGDAQGLGLDAFISKLMADGSALDFSTLLGGSGTDTPHSVAIAHDGSVYVAGETDSADFPVGQAFQNRNAGMTDGFVSKLSASGTELAYSTYLGGSGNDAAVGIVVDEAGNAFVTGPTISTDSPLTQEAFQIAAGGSSDGFIAKLAPGDPGGEHKITGVLDAAGFQALISPGSIVSVFGNFVETTATAGAIPMSEDLNGFSVTFNGIPGALFGVFDGPFDQSNVQVPWNVDVSSGKVEVKVHWKDDTSEVWSDPFEADAALASKGIYMHPPGTTQAIVTNFKQAGDDVIAGSWVQPSDSIPGVVTQPTAIGGVATIWCNGLGPVSPVPATGDLPQPSGTAPVTEKAVRVFVGGKVATVLGAVLQSSSVGLNQINIIIPEGVTPGEAVPIVIEVECLDGTKIRSREDATIAVRAAP